MRTFLILIIIALSSNFSFSQQKSTDKESDAFHLVDLALEKTVNLKDDIVLDYDFYRDVRVDSFACMYWYSKYLASHPDVFEFRTFSELLNNMENTYELMNKETGFELSLIFISKSCTSETSLEITVGANNYRHITLTLNSGMKMFYSRNWTNTILENEWEISFFSPHYVNDASIVKVKNSDELLYVSIPIKDKEIICSNLDLYMKNKKPWNVDQLTIKENTEATERYKEFKEIFEEEIN